MNPFKLAATILHLFTAIAVLELIGTEVLLTVRKHREKLRIEERDHVQTIRKDSHTLRAV